MAGYSGTPLYQKLGLKEGCRVALFDAPESVRLELCDAPFPFTWVDGPHSGLDVVLFFTSSYEELERRFESLIALLAPAGGLWICWPKRASRVPTDVTEDRLRDLFLPRTPMVDNKVCAIDATWSGLRFVRRIEFR